MKLLNFHTKKFHKTIKNMNINKSQKNLQCINVITSASVSISLQRKYEDVRQRIIKPLREISYEIENLCKKL
jgi:hypothetical protein